MQKAPDRPDLVARVFNLKLKDLMANLIDHNLLGAVIGYIYVIEFQMRGLPHAHILLIMYPRVSNQIFILYQPCLYDQ